MRMTLTKIATLFGAALLTACSSTPSVPEYSVDPNLMGDERSVFVDTLNILSSDLRDSLNMIGLDNKVYRNC